MIRRSFVMTVVAVMLTGASFASIGVASANSGGDLARIAQSGQALTKAGSAKFAGKVDIMSTGGSSSVPNGSVSFTGAFDFKHRNGRFTIDASALGTTAASGKIQFLLVNGVAYISIASFKGLTAGTLPSVLAGKKWLKLDLTALGASSGSLGQVNPSSSLDTLLGVTNDAQNLGKATIGGASTTHYRIHIDLAKAVQAASPGQRAAVQKSVDALGGTGILPADIWIDGSGRPRKVSVSFSEKQGTTNANATETFEYSDFGVPVSVGAPPASDVFDFSQLFSQLGGAGSTSTS